jgi:hypothetical protein
MQLRILSDRSIVRESDDENRWWAGVGGGSVDKKTARGVDEVRNDEDGRRANHILGQVDEETETQEV